MTKRDNRTLFGRLMGSSATDDDQYGTGIQVNYELEEAEELLEDSEEDEIDDEEEQTPTQNRVPEVHAVPAQTKQADGWIADYEGQLNIDMYQTKDNVIIKSTVAGVRPEDIDITVANDVVTVRGSRKREEDAPQDDYFYQECYWGSFSRSVIVPVDIDSEHIEADLKDGMLTIVIPKAAKAKTKKVKVRGL